MPVKEALKYTRTVAKRTRLGKIRVTYCKNLSRRKRGTFGRCREFIRHTEDPRGSGSDKEDT